MNYDLIVNLDLQLLFRAGLDWDPFKGLAVSEGKGVNVNV